MAKVLARLQGFKNKLYFKALSEILHLFNITLAFPILVE